MNPHAYDVFNTVLDILDKIIVEMRTRNLQLNLWSDQDTLQMALSESVPTWKQVLHANVELTLSGPMIIVRMWRKDLFYAFEGHLVSFYKHNRIPIRSFKFFVE